MARKLTPEQEKTDKGSAAWRARHRYTLPPFAPRDPIDKQEEAELAELGLSVKAPEFQGIPQAGRPFPRTDPSATQVEEHLLHERGPRIVPTPTGSPLPGSVYRMGAAERENYNLGNILNIKGHPAFGDFFVIPYSDEYLKRNPGSPKSVFMSPTDFQVVVKGPLDADIENPGTRKGRRRYPQEADAVIIETTWSQAESTAMAKPDSPLAGYLNTSTVWYRPESNETIGPGDPQMWGDPTHKPGTRESSSRAYFGLSQRPEGSPDPNIPGIGPTATFGAAGPKRVLGLKRKATTWKGKGSKETWDFSYEIRDKHGNWVKMKREGMTLQEVMSEGLLDLARDPTFKAGDIINVAAGDNKFSLWNVDTNAPVTDTGLPADPAAPVSTTPSKADIEASNRVLGGDTAAKTRETTLTTKQELAWTSLFKARDFLLKYPQADASSILALSTQIQNQLKFIGGLHGGPDTVYGTAFDFGPLDSVEAIKAHIEGIIAQQGGWDRIIADAVTALGDKNLAEFTKEAEERYMASFVKGFSDQLDQMLLSAGGNESALATNSDYLDVKYMRDYYESNMDRFVGIFASHEIGSGAILWDSSPEGWSDRFVRFFTQQGGQGKYFIDGMGDQGLVPFQTAQDYGWKVTASLRREARFGRVKEQRRQSYNKATTDLVGKLLTNEDSLLATLRELLQAPIGGGYDIDADWLNDLQSSIEIWGSSQSVSDRWDKYQARVLAGEDISHVQHVKDAYTREIGLTVAEGLAKRLGLGEQGEDGGPLNQLAEKWLGITGFTGNLDTDMRTLKAYNAGVTKWKNLRAELATAPGTFDMATAMRYAFEGLDGVKLTAEDAAARAKLDRSRGPGGVDLLNFRSDFNTKLLDNGMTVMEFNSYSGITIDDIISLYTDKNTGHFDQANATKYFEQFMASAIRMQKTVQLQQKAGMERAQIIAASQQQIKESVIEEEKIANEKARIFMSTNLIGFGITEDEALGSMVPIDPDDPDSPKEWQWASDLGPEAIALMQGRDLAADPMGEEGLTQILLRSASFRIVSREYGMTVGELVDLALNGGLNPMTGEEMEGVVWTDSPSESPLDAVLAQKAVNIKNFTNRVLGLLQAGSEEAMRLEREDTIAADAFNNQGIRKPDGTMWTPEDMQRRRQGARGQTGVTVSTTGRGGDQFPGGRYTGEAARRLIFNQVYGGGRSAGAPDSPEDLTDAQIQHGLSRLPGLGIAPAVIEMIGQVALHGTGTKPTTYAKPTDQLGWEAYGRTREQLEEQGLTVSEIEDILTRQKEAVDEYGRGVQRQETAAGAPDTGTTPDTAGGERKTAQTIAGPTVQQIHEDLPVPGNRFPRR
jgi:hypothetical protein